MAKSIHFINRRENGKLIGLEKHERNNYSSEAWKLPVDAVDELIGGWIYLHGAKEDPSVFGGVVDKIELVDPTEGRYKIYFEAKIEAKGQDWRGADHSMAWTSGLVDPTAEHERT